MVDSQGASNLSIIHSKSTCITLFITISSNTVEWQPAQDKRATYIFFYFQSLEDFRGFSKGNKFSKTQASTLKR